MKNMRLWFSTLIFISFTACTHVPSKEEPSGMSGASPGGAVSRAVTMQKPVTKPVSFAVLQDYPKGEDFRDVEKDFALMKELGVSTWRGSFSWIDYEPERGEYDYPWLHKFVSMAAKEGITLRPYLAYTPAWAAKGGSDEVEWNDPPKRITDWRRFVARTVKELKKYPNIASYEIYNEENVKQWWDGTAQEYNKVLKAAAEEVEEVSPRYEVIMGGMVWPDEDWVAQACANGNARKIDIVPIHAYPETWTPKEVTVENYLDQARPGHFNKVFLPVVDKKCARQPVWLNEVGFATPPGKSELDQANWWARAFATFLSHPRVEHIGIYQVRDRLPTTEVIGESENYYLGLTRTDRKKKLAFHTVKRLISLLNVGKLTVADADLSVEVTDGKKGALYHHLFVRPDGRQVLFVWDKKGSPTLRLKPRPGTTVTEYSLDGTAMPFTSYDGRALSNVRLEPRMVRIFEIR